jgi:hypothetical protein
VEIWPKICIAPFVVSSGVGVVEVEFDPAAGPGPVVLEGTGVVGAAVEIALILQTSRAMHVMISSPFILGC